MTNEEVMQLMTDMGLHEGGIENWVMDNAWFRVVNKAIEKERAECAVLAMHIARQSVAEEREACARLFDDRDNGIGFYEPHEPAEIIRARGQV